MVQNQKEQTMPKTAAILIIAVLLSASCAHTPPPTPTARPAYQILDEIGAALSRLQQVRTDLESARLENDRAQTLLLALQATAEAARLLNICTELSEALRFSFFYRPAIPQ